MTSPEYFAVFPDGDRMEVPGPLRVGSLVDLNARPLPLPLPTNRMIAYEVTGVRRREDRGVDETYYRLDLVPARDLLAYCIPQG